MVSKRSARIGFVAAASIIALAIAYRWRAPSGVSEAPRDSLAIEGGGRSGAAGADAGPVASRQPQASSGPAAPSAVPLPGERIDAAPVDPAPNDEALRELVAGIDPLLGQSNMIVRAPGPGQNGPGLIDVESRFRAESTDADWSGQMESRILDQVSRIADLSLVTLEAECRETLCRIKLFYPPGADALSSGDRLKPVATELGFGHVVTAATLEENGVSMSLLYFQRESA